MKRIAVITFHSSYNFGSNLQAFALQEYIKQLCDNNCLYNIINLQKKEQDEMYKIYDEISFRNFIKRILFIGYKKDIKRKEELFENFINNKLNITEKYKTLKEIKNAELKYDYYISGSDQVWNLNAHDFDWANLLEFVNDGKKISYAASFGPAKQTWNDEQKQRMKKDLELYDNLSVREEGSFNNVVELINKNPEIHVDPTMLLKKEKWESLIGEKKVYNNDYIFYYDLNGKKENIELVKKISKELNIPVIIANNHHKIHLIKEFEKMYQTGPIEFLNLIKNAKLVLSSSFHGTVFSILLNKPFFALNGNNDFRISTLLNKMKLSDRSIDCNNYSEKIKYSFEIKFNDANKELDIEREKSEKYLKKVLEL